MGYGCAESTSVFTTIAGSVTVIFRSPTALRGHQETHERRDVICKKYDRGFPSLSAMAKHVGKCYGQPTQPQFVKKIRDLQAKTGNPNLFTVPPLGYGDNNASYRPVQASAKTGNGHPFESFFAPQSLAVLSA